MTQEEFRRLLELNEDEHIEFKEAKSSFDTDKLAAYAVALANERGGKLVLGVSDKKPRKIVGTSAYLHNTAKVKEQVIRQLGLRVEFEELLLPEGRVLVVHVPSRPIGRALCINGTYYMRAGEALTGMSFDMIARIAAETGPDYSAEVAPGARLEDLDPEAIADFRRRWAQKAGRPELLSMSVDSLLGDAELIVGGVPTIAAMALLGKHESLGRLRLGHVEVVFEYRANDAPGPAQVREEFRQGFFSFYDRLWGLIDLRNTKQSFQDGFFMHEIKTFNEGAIREAILNAVSHRDYRSGANVFVRQYPERIEITSPGGLPPGVRLENILNEQFPRNRRIAETLGRAGLVERSGQGMNRIFASCIRETKQAPDFSNTDADHFWITLHGRIRQPEFLRVLEKIGQDRLLSFSADDFIALQMIYDGRPVPENLRYVVDRFLEEGIAERVPSGKARDVVLARKFYSAIGKEGVHTRKRGLDRETNKELLLRHLKDSEPKGARMEELLQVLPALDRHLVRSLLRNLEAENRVRVVGTTKAARWHLITSAGKGRKA